MFRLLKSLFRLFIFVIIISGLIFAYSKYIEPFHLKIEKIKISSRYINEDTEGLHILAFADTHFGEYYTTEDFKKVVKAIEKENPDIVFFLGDLIDHYKEYTKTENISEISRLLSEIKAPYGKYAVFGNHDYGGGAENIYEDIMTAGGFQVLVNDSLLIKELGIKIIGIDDVVIGYGDPKIGKEANADLFNIILSHAPDVADEIITYNIDLMLAGHTHGRQINLSYFDDTILPPYGKKYIKGLYPLNTERNAYLYVNSGIGMTQLPLRFLSPPEITIFTLEKP
ncbi:MAG: metallophosphoesterase [Anaerovoracaceae bacterium]|jgi:predicted MPP superfamily phosphohydrolase